MKITSNVIQDLLPLYLAGEAHADTVRLVKEYLETDAELAKQVENATMYNLSEIPVPRKKEAEVSTYKKAQWRTVVLTLGLAMIIVITVLTALLILGAFVLAAPM